MPYIVGAVLNGIGNWLSNVSDPSSEGQWKMSLLFTYGWSNSDISGIDAILA